MRPGRFLTPLVLTKETKKIHCDNRVEFRGPQRASLLGMTPDRARHNPYKRRAPLSDPTVGARFLKALATGVSLTQAARYAGCSGSNLHSWLTRGKAARPGTEAARFYEAVQRAMVVPVIESAQVWQEAIRKRRNWKAAAQFLSTRGGPWWKPAAPEPAGLNVNVNVEQTLILQARAEVVKQFDRHVAQVQHAIASGRVPPRAWPQASRRRRKDRAAGACAPRRCPRAGWRRRHRGAVARDKHTTSAREWPPYMRVPRRAEDRRCCARPEAPIGSLGQRPRRSPVSMRLRRECAGSVRVVHSML
jgi:hypothetical protein